MQDYYNCLVWITIVLLILAFGLLIFSTFTVKSKKTSLLKCNVEIKEKIHLLIMATIGLALITTWSLKELTENPLYRISNAAYEYYICLSKEKNADICDNKHNFLFARVSEAEMYSIESSKITAAINSGKYDALANQKNNPDKALVKSREKGAQ